MCAASRLWRTGPEGRAVSGLRLSIAVDFSALAGRDEPGWAGAGEVGFGEVAVIG